MQESAFRGALKTLDVLGCRYRVVLPDGAERSTLPEPAEPARKKRKKLHDVPHGLLRPAARRLIEDMQYGEYRRLNLYDFDYSDIPFDVFAKTINSTAHKLFGTCGYETKRVPPTPGEEPCKLEIYRFTVLELLETMAERDDPDGSKAAGYRKD